MLHPINHFKSATDICPQVPRKKYISDTILKNITHNNFIAIYVTGQQDYKIRQTLIDIVNRFVLA